MKDKVRIGIIGISRAKSFVQKLAANDKADVSAICGRTPDSARLVAQKLSIPYSYSNYEEMYEKAALDAVIVTTPDHLHHPMSLEALHAGLHVLCEKPLALNAAQAEDMLKAAESHGLKHMTCFSRRWTPEICFLGELLSKNTIGNWYEFRGHWLAGMNLGSEKSPFKEYYKSSRKEWRLNKKQSSGVLSDFASHMFDLIQVYFSPISAVSASLLSRDQEGQRLESRSSRPPETIAIAIHLTNGRHGTLNISKIANVKPEILFEVYGEGGFIRSKTGIGVSEVVVSLGDHEDSNVLEVPETMKNAPDICNLFVSSILEDKTIQPTFADGLSIQRIMDAAIDSNNSGKWVSL